MEYLNLHTSVLDSAEFVGADQIERGAWLCLQGYCIKQENGGVIADCGWWKDRQWQQTAKVTLREVRRAAPRLWEWVGNDLHLFFYPKDAEEQVKAKRETARANGRTGGRPKKKTVPKTHEKPTLVIFEKAKGKEREGKENNTPQPPEGGASEGADDLLISKIKSLRQEWQASPLLSAREQRPFGKNRQLLALFPAEAWPVLREFLAARIPESAAVFQPILLQKFLENPGGVLGQATAWKAKQRPRQPAVLPLPIPDGPAATAAEIAEFFKKPEPQRMNS